MAKIEPVNFRLIKMRVVLLKKIAQKNQKKKKKKIAHLHRMRGTAAKVNWG